VTITTFKPEVMYPDTRPIEVLQYMSMNRMVWSHEILSRMNSSVFLPCKCLPWLGYKAISNINSNLEITMSIWRN